MFEKGTKVEHVSEPSFGEGEVRGSDEVAGQVTYMVRWSNQTSSREHAAGELRRVESLPERLADVGVADVVPFTLKVLARWFEARHALTGELSNQPFEMLPHQVLVTNRVVSSRADDRAWLIADDVGLGKTIEAGMIHEVLRKQTLSRWRCLVITPAGLMPQWKEELERRFGRAYRIFESGIPADLEQVDQLIASIDTLKLKKHIDAIAQATPWDLVIIDEAHHLATTPDVQSYQLAQRLRDLKKAKNLLFLTATPHSGNKDHFANMMRLLREDLFPKGASEVPVARLKEVMIRNRKSEVTDAKGKKIFNGIAPAKIIGFRPTEDEVEFYENMRDYLRTGYKEAQRLKRSRESSQGAAVGFLMATFGKLAASSRAAIESALRNRLEALNGEEVAQQDAGAPEDARFPGEQEFAKVRSLAIETGRGKRKSSPIANEKQQVEGLLDQLSKLGGDDSKLEAFLDSVERFPTEEKMLIFTEYRATQDVLVERLVARYGESAVATIHGSMSRQERRNQVERFNEHTPNPRFMVSTEAGGEGLNMQKSCHTVVNYDLPWNPMALQQRIGRVYRYGQRHPVVVFNLKVESTSEAFADQKVHEYLERKIEEITKTLAGVQDGDPEDIRLEVLGELVNEIPFDQLYEQAVAEGLDKAKRELEKRAQHFEEIVRDPERALGIFRGLGRFDITDYQKVAARVGTEQLEYFVQKYLGRAGVPVKRGADGLMSFKLTQDLVAAANRVQAADKYEYRPTVTLGTIEKATVDKDAAQRALGCRLMRFGDLVFEGMVSHVQQGGYTRGVASLSLPAKSLAWSRGSRGTWVLFDLRIVRSETTLGERVLRHELVSMVVPEGQAPASNDALVEVVHLADDGPMDVDVEEARRAYALARAAAEARISLLRKEVIDEIGTDVGVMAQPVRDVGLAWVRAS